VRLLVVLRVVVDSLLFMKDSPMLGQQEVSGVLGLVIMLTGDPPVVGTGAYVRLKQRAETDKSNMLSPLIPCRNMSQSSIPSP